MPIVHAAGCGQGGADLAQTRRVLLGTAGHPNVGAALLVGLGCETLDTAGLADELARAGQLVRHLLIQHTGGTSVAVERGVELARELLGAAADVARRPADLSDLIVAAECGASDAFSAVSANPVVGRVADRLIAAGGTFMISETDECIGAEHILARRTRDQAARRGLLDAIARCEREAAAAGVNLMGAQINPGNFEGGLTTPEEKSLGAVLKGGSGRLAQVVGYGERPTRRGLVLMDTPGEDVESITGMVAGGAALVLFTTGRGTPVGNPIAPVIKIASNTALARRMAENIDLDAGPILAGDESIENVAGRIWAEMLAVAGGKPARAELLGHREFTINRVGPRL